MSAGTIDLIRCNQGCRVQFRPLFYLTGPNVTPLGPPLRRGPLLLRGRRAHLGPISQRRRRQFGGKRRRRELGTDGGLTGAAATLTVVAAS